MSIEVTVFDKLLQEFSEASRAFKEFEGEVARIKFNPNDRDNVKAAVSQMRKAVDHKLTPYRGNLLVVGLAAKLKESYEAALLKNGPDALHPATE